MPDPFPRFHLLRCERSGPVTVAITDPSAFDRGDDPYGEDTKPELAEDLALLTETSPGAVVLDIRATRSLSAMGSARTFQCFRRLAAAGKSFAVCASADLVALFEISTMNKKFPRTTELAAAIAAVSPAD